jgi:hypothetical protein
MEPSLAIESVLGTRTRTCRLISRSWMESTSETQPCLGPEDGRRRNASQRNLMIGFCDERIIGCGDAEWGQRGSLSRYISE